jgi:colanic acid/amylovoran biosynthesis glycosyltransferase
VNQPRNGIRLAYLLKKFPRLSETFVLNEILAQEDSGASIHVFSRRTPDDEPPHPQLARLRAEVEVLPGTSAMDPWKELFVKSDGENVARMGEAVRSMQRFELPRLPKLCAEALYVLRRTKELGIDHVHSHFATESAIVAMLVHELGGPPYSITAHAKDIYRSTVDPELLSRLIERSAFTVTVCDANVRFLQDRISSEARAKLRRLYNGIDLEMFQPAAAERAPNHVLAVGRLVEKKGFDVLLDAIARLTSSGVELKATIVGDGDEREALAGQVARLGLMDRVTLAGPMDQARVRALIMEATVFCLPCVIGTDGNRDALPTVLIEALASGLPAISTPVTGVPEILGDDAGVLVPERDPAATAAALERLIRDPAERARIAALGRAR